MTPKVINLYQKAFEDKQQADFDSLNYSAWLNGMYVMNAIGACLDKKVKYPDHALENDSAKAVSVPDVSAIKFGEWANAFNQNMKGSGESGK